LKVLVFEYINGGGFAGRSVSPSLQREGMLMLQTLLHELKSLSSLQCVVTLDRRCQNLDLASMCQVIWIDDTESLFDQLHTALIDCDAFWPIAPETDDILASWVQMAESHGVLCLSSDAATIRLCADKSATCRALHDAGLPVVETRSLADHLDEMPFEHAVVKPVDGVGCEGSRVLSDVLEYRAWVHTLTMPEAYVVQPLIAGAAKSWSALCRHGRAWLLSCNQQLVTLEGQHFSLQACCVNVDGERHADYQALLDVMAGALPGLWGYVGIDFIDDDVQGPLILEINPRLTTSYTGIQAATGINVAEQVLHAIDAEPRFSCSMSHSVLVSIS